MALITVASEKMRNVAGVFLLRMGDPEYERIASDNIKLLNSLSIETLVTSCSGCFKTIKEDYPKVGGLNFEVLHTVEFLTPFDGSKETEVRDSSRKGDHIS